MPEFQDIEVARGRYIGWGRQGQTVTVRVDSYDPVGGTDANDRPCPQLVGTLTEAADNYRERGTVHERLDTGELVTVTAGIANLKAGLLAADPHPGDLVRMEFADTYKTAKGTGKVIKVQIARGNPAAVTADDI